LVTEIPAAVLAAVRDGRLSVQRLQDAARRTASLAELAEPVKPIKPAGGSAEAGGSPEAGGSAEPTAAAAAELAAIAARCIEVQGPLPTLHRPLVLECRTENGMASGTLPWTLADRIRNLAPDAEVMLVEGEIRPDTVLSASAGRGLVCVLRDPSRNPWQESVLAVAGRHAAAGEPVVLVDVGWPARLPEPAAGLPIVRTRGIAPGLLDAAAAALFPQH
jgi:beta-N-acetylhexosaminidase